MPAVSAAVTFKSAGFMRRKMGVNECFLLRIVAMGKVRVRQTEPHPQFCVQDVEACLRQETEHEGTFVRSR